MRRVARVAAALALCAAAAVTTSTAATSPARPPIDLAAAARSGIDLKAPVELVFEWRVSQLPTAASVEAVTQLLARHGFAVTVTREQTAQPVVYRHSVTGRRTALTRQSEVDALAAQLAPLVAGSGATSWSVTQKK